MHINRYYKNEEIKREDMKKYIIVSQLTLDAINRVSRRETNENEINHEHK